MRLVKGVVFLGLNSVLGLLLYWNLSSAPNCDLPPLVNNATISTFETGPMFIIGSQVNYSCSEWCILQGSYSLRCAVQDHVATWPDPPTCSCLSENAYVYLVGFTYNYTYIAYYMSLWQCRYIKWFCCTL